MDTLLFGTAGIPESSKPRNAVNGVRRLKALGLDAMEIEYVRGSFPGIDAAHALKSAAVDNGVRLTAHAPYYINLYARDAEKRDASRMRIRRAAEIGYESGAESVVFHAGFFLGDSHETVYGVMRDEIAGVVEDIRRAGIELDIRPEVMGKPSQFGSLEDVLFLSRELNGVAPCIDWAHLHARTAGEMNTASEFLSVLDMVGDMLGEESLKTMHMHVSGIEYTSKGERKHRRLDESTFDWRSLLEVLKRRDVGGILICESPSPEKDALKSKQYYDSL